MANIGAYITPQNVAAAFQIGQALIELARKMGRQRGMTEEQIEAAYQESKLDSNADFGDYVRAIGGVWPPVTAPAVEDDEPALSGDVLYYDELREDVTTFQSIMDVPRDRFSRGDRIYLTNPRDGGDFARFVFVLPALVPRADVVQRFNATMIGYI